MDHVATNVHGQITANRARLGLKGLCGSDQLTGAGDHAISFPNHGHHRAGGDEIHQASEERTLFMHAVVLFSQFTAGGDLLQADELEPLALEAAEDLTHQPTLHTIGLDGDKSAFGSHDIDQKTASSSVAAHPVGKHSPPSHHSYRSFNWQSPPWRRAEPITPGLSPAAPIFMV